MDVNIKQGNLLSLSFLLFRLLPNHRRYRKLQLHLIMLTDTHTHTVGLLWTRDRSVAEALNCTTHSIHQRQTFHAPGGIQTINCSKRAAADPRPRSGDPDDPYRRLFRISVYTFLFIKALIMTSHKQVYSRLA